MKKIIVNNKLYVFMIGLFIIFGFLSIIPLKGYEKNQNHMLNYYNSVINDCKNKKSEDMTPEETKNCNYYIETFNENEFNMTAFYGYENYVLDFYRTYFGEFITILIVIICSTYYISKFLRNRVIINHNNRRSYQKTIKNLFFSSWRYALLVPLILIVMFILTYIVTGSGNDGYSYLENTMFENNVMFYFIMVLIQSIILTLIHINITLIVSRKEHNYIISIIKSFICVIGISLFIDIINNNLIYGLLKLSKGIDFNILAIYNLFNVENFSYTMMWNIIFLIVSFAILFISYKNKEKLIIDSEKNDNKNEE